MPVEIGESFSFRYKGRHLMAEIVDTKLLNPGDRFSYTKRDSNPIVKLTVKVPELKVLLHPQIEVTDSDDENLQLKLKELVALSLTRGEAESYTNL
ncbi:MAG: hypothetical protein JNN15_11850 [Blastocatellia bacterium]|nr:hypothetical protein [Blastocatellia bacterium]